MSRTGLWDSHAHLDSDYFTDDRDELITKIGEEMDGFINPGCDEESSAFAVQLAEKYDFVYAAVGWHPEDLAGIKDRQVPPLRCSLPKSTILYMRQSAGTRRIWPALRTDIIWISWRRGRHIPKLSLSAKSGLIIIGRKTSRKRCRKSACWSRLTLPYSLICR